MADKESKDDARAEGDTAGMRDADDIRLPVASDGPLPAAMVHRDSHSQMKKVEQ